MRPEAELQHHIAELTDFIVDLAPEARVDYEQIIHEDEHANLSVYPPLAWDEAQCMELQERIGAHVSDLHIETGYLILVYVCTPEQQIQEAEQTLTHAQQQLKGAERVLAEARALGLYQVSSVKSELISA